MTPGHGPARSAASHLSVVIAGRHRLYREAVSLALRGEGLVATHLPLSHVPSAVARPDVALVVAVVAGPADEASLMVDQLGRRCAPLVVLLPPTPSGWRPLLDGVDADAVLPTPPSAAALASQLRHGLTRGWAGAVGRASPRRTSLTEREREVLDQLAGGLSVAEAAGVLGISPKTLRTHLANAMAKLGARTRWQALRLTRDESAWAGPSAPEPRARSGL